MYELIMHPRYRTRQDYIDVFPYDLLALVSKYPFNLIIRMNYVAYAL